MEPSQAGEGGNRDLGASAVRRSAYGCDDDRIYGEASCDIHSAPI